MLLVALLERGGPVTLEEVASRMEELGIAPRASALASLKKCKPARPPIHRDGDHYVLDPHDDEADMWAFRLGIRPSRIPKLSVVRPPERPLPSPDEPLEVADLEEAWRHETPWIWSSQRLAICVLDAHGGRLPPEAVVRFIADRARGGRTVRVEDARYWRRGAPIQAAEDGSWVLDRNHKAVRPARIAVREKVEVERRNVRRRPDPAVQEALQKAHERERRAKIEAFARERRVLVHAFPAEGPQAVVLLDIKAHTIETLMGEDLAGIGGRLAAYDYLCGLEIRPLLRELDFDPGARRVMDLGPPQKTMQLNRRGRALKITTDLLIRGSCNISRPLGDPKKMSDYLRRGATTKLRRRLESDAKSLHALHEYGRLHGCVRLRWGFIDTDLRVPWRHWEEPILLQVMHEAAEEGRMLEVVTGTAPGWEDPWVRGQLVRVGGGLRRFEHVLVAEDGVLIDPRDVQRTREADGRADRELDREDGKGQPGEVAPAETTDHPQSLRRAPIRTAGRGRERISEDTRVPIRFTAAERGLLEDLVMDPDYVERMWSLQGSSDLAGEYTLDDLEDMLGYISAEANHTPDPGIQAKLYRLHDRLFGIQRSFDDGTWNDSGE